MSHDLDCPPPIDQDAFDREFHARMDAAIAMLLRAMDRVNRELSAKHRERMKRDDHVQLPLLPSSSPKVIDYETI